MKNESEESLSASKFTIVLPIFSMISRCRIFWGPANVDTPKYQGSSCWSPLNGYTSSNGYLRSLDRLYIMHWHPVVMLLRCSILVIGNFLAKIPLDLDGCTAKIPPLSGAITGSYLCYPLISESYLISNTSLFFPWSVSQLLLLSFYSWFVDTCATVQIEAWDGMHGTTSFGQRFAPGPCCTAM